ncbi:MAG: hypothetical protein ACR2NW_03980 [Thermodesulfobacteriota bacterium]
MNKIQIRPRFNIEVEFSKNEILERIQKEIKNSNGNCEGKLLDNHIVLKIPENKQKFWSPELSIEIDEINNKRLLRCLLGPKSTVWTLFATFYGLSIFIGLIGLVLGFSQWSIGMKPLGLWLVPLSLILIIIAYFIALSGQKLAYKEMVFLREILDRSLEL